jgi:hypothetical protein
MRPSKRLAFLFLLLLTVLLLLPFFNSGNRVVAQDYSFDSSTRLPTLTHDGITYPDWSRLSLSSISPIEQAGSIDLSSLTSQFGYDPSRSWEAGERIENILQLGDMMTSTNLPDWNLSTIASVVPLALDDLKLSDFGLLKNQSIEDLVLAMPWLSSQKLRSIKPLFDLAKTAFGVGRTFGLGNKSLGNLVKNFEFAKSLKLDELDLSQYDLTSILGID